MVMPYLRGETLKDLRLGISSGRHEPLDQEAILHLILPVLDALGFLHDASVFHRDISPDNILLPEGGGDPILLDFGAARRAITDSTQSFTTILKPSYAPIEQYAQSSTLRQGPWTDIYALGAVVHYLLLGYAPAPSTTRTIHDEHPSLADQRVSGCSREFLAAIDWALAVSPLHRPQSVADLRAVLTGDAPLPLAYVPQESPLGDEDFERTEVMPRDSGFQKTQAARGARDPAPSRTLVPSNRAQATPSADASRSRNGPPTKPPPQASARAQANKAPQSKMARGMFLGGMIALGGLVLLLVAAGAGWALRGNSQTDGGAAAAMAGKTPPGAASAVVTPQTLASATPTVSPPPGANASSGAAPGGLLTAGGATTVAGTAAASAPPTLKPGAANPLASAAAQKPGAARNAADAKRGNSGALVPLNPQPVVASPEPVHEEPPPAPRPQPVAEKGPPPGFADPVKACAKEEADDPVKKIGNYLLRTWCIDRMCEKSAYFNHAECVKLRELRAPR
jgi:hypothetical protein